MDEQAQQPLQESNPQPIESKPKFFASTTKKNQILIFVVFIIILLLGIFSDRLYREVKKIIHEDFIVAGIERIDAKDFDRDKISLNYSTKPGKSKRGRLKYILPDKAKFYDTFPQLDSIINDGWEPPASLVANTNKDTAVYYGFYNEVHTGMTIGVYSAQGTSSQFWLPTPTDKKEKLSQSCDWLSEYTIMCQIAVGTVRYPEELYIYLINTKTESVTLIEGELSQQFDGYYSIDEQAPYFLVDSSDKEHILFYSKDDLSLYKTIDVPSGTRFLHFKEGNSDQNCDFYGQEYILCNLYAPDQEPGKYAYNLDTSTWTFRDDTRAIVISSGLEYAAFYECPYRRTIGLDMSGYVECEHMVIYLEKNGENKTKIMDIVRRGTDHFEAPILTDGENFYIRVENKKGSENAGATKAYYVINPKQIL